MNVGVWSMGDVWDAGHSLVLQEGWALATGLNRSYPCEGHSRAKAQGVSHDITIYPNDYELEGLELL